ncbi:MAG TPA: winged helix-turn-helix domain-containing protein [Hypericibacter adhaerens]|jgi:DNA-binding transcriptional ArsR family regulator|nr:winged helix-turn-helix domain-containing protein [Hypericibacter adhaerens]HWA43912.1 winged helix-turn-helix domain-containing protein [Hypericibacter adhaerens]
MSIREPYFAGVAALMGDPARANILAALMDGRALTAKELALIAGVSAPTTSGHLAKLVDGGLLDVIEQGRYRYFRLANSLVACAIEGMMALSGEHQPRRRLSGARGGEALRLARTCYDHLAGKLGVAVMDRLLAQGHLHPGATDFQVSRRGHEFLTGLGIDAASVARQRRGFARPCLDWSERRPHLAGALGAALGDRCFEVGWIERQRDGRAVTITAAGRRGFRESFGIELLA